MKETNDPLVSLDHERCLLGSMILSQVAATRMAALATPAMFWSKPHQTIFTTLQTLTETGQSIGVLELRTELGDKLEEVGGIDYLLQLAEEVPSAANYDHFFTVVNNLYMRRQLVRLGHDIERGDWGGETDALYAFLRHSTAGNPVTVGDVDLSARKARQTVRTGISAIDDYTQGLDIGETGVCLMPSGAGKSAFLIGRALHAARSGIGALYLSLSDLDEEAIKRRMMRMMCGMSYAPTDADGLAKWNAAEKELSSLDIHLHATFNYRGGNKIKNILALITEARRRRGVKMVVIDYVQMITPEGRNTYEHSVQCEQDVRLLTNRLKIATWLGSQVTESETGGKVKGGTHWNEGSALTVYAEFIPQKAFDEKVKQDPSFKARVEGYEPLILSNGKARHVRKFKRVIVGLNDRLEFVEL